MGLATGLAFFDSNVLLYADDARFPAKRTRAVSLYAEHRRRGTAVVSLQVMQEYYSAATRKLGVPEELAQKKAELLGRCKVVQFTSQDVVIAIELHRLRRISFWDAMIVHAARISRASVLYSEDIRHGSLVGGVRIENPFAGSE
jgi:predicted nucleic acid-binding protein